MLSDNIITPPIAFPKEALSIEQAMNVLRHRSEVLKGSRVKDWALGQVSTTPISVAPFKDRDKFLRYALSLCEGRPMFVALLRLKIHMAGMPQYSNFSKQQVNKFIAQHLTGALKRVIRPEQVAMLEKEAIDFVQQEIARTKNIALPLVGV